MPYYAVPAGEWQSPVRRGYKMQCCDCDLVHTLDFRLIRQGAGRVIQLRAYRNSRATAAFRRKRRGRRGAK